MWNTKIAACKEKTQKEIAAEIGVHPSTISREYRRNAMPKGGYIDTKAQAQAEAPTDVFQQIQSDLAEVQQAYENKDSIIVLPITTDYLRMMKIIGQHIAVDVITHNKSTLFF